MKCFFKMMFILIVDKNGNFTVCDKNFPETEVHDHPFHSGMKRSRCRPRSMRVTAKYSMRDTGTEWIVKLSALLTR